MSEYSKGYKVGYQDAIKELQRKVMSSVGDSEFLVDIGRKDGKRVFVVKVEDVKLAFKIHGIGGDAE